MPLKVIIGLIVYPGELRFTGKVGELYFDFDSACQGQFEAIVGKDNNLVSYKDVKVISDA